MRDKQSHSQNTSDTIQEKAAFLAHTSLFHNLTPQERQELDHATTMIHCSSGRVLYRPGEVGNTLFLVRTGRVQLYHLSTDGRKLITALIEAGECFGEMSLIGQDVYTSFAEAIEDSRICILSKQEAERLLQHNPTIALALLQIVGQRLLQREAQLIDTTFKSTSARLAALLLQLARPHEHATSQFVIDGLSQEELAEQLGVYRETVSVALRELKDAGVITLGRKHITIMHPQELQALASV